MPAPTNDSFETATELGALPATVTQNPHFGGLSYWLYFKFTAPATGMIGVFPFGDLANYFPYVAIYVGPANDPEEIDPPVNPQNVPGQFWATQGVEYFIECRVGGPDANPAIELTLAVEAFAPQKVVAGDICVCDGNIGFPLAIANGTTGAMRAFQHPFATTENHGISLASGYLLIEDTINGSPDTFEARIYNPIRQLVASPTIPGPENTQQLIVSCNSALNKFYAGRGYNGVTPTTVNVLSHLGVVEETHELTGAIGLVTMCPSLNGETLLFTDDLAVNIPIQAWDLVNDVALPDFAPGLGAGLVLFHDLILLADGTYLAGYLGPGHIGGHVVHYDVDGTILDNWTVDGLNRLCTTLSDPLTFLMSLFNVVGDPSTFKERRIADGVDIVEAPTYLFDQGVYSDVAEADPPARFGISGSESPMWVARVNEPPASGTPTRLRKLRRFPLPFDRSKWIYVRRIEFLIQPGVGLTTGQGQYPDLEVRFSGDGGITWGDIIFVPMGETGDRQLRAVINNVGKFRNGWCEVSDSDPVISYLLACFVDVEESET